MKITSNHGRLDLLAQTHTCSSTFPDLLNASGHYRPSIYLLDPSDEIHEFVTTAGEVRKLTTAERNAELAELANAYDWAQARIGDSRRAYRGGSWPTELVAVLPSHLLRAGDAVSIYLNQAERDGTVLATIGEQVLISYQMPAGRVFLGVQDYGKRICDWRTERTEPAYTSKSYSLPAKWVDAIREQDGPISVADWMGGTSCSDWRAEYHLGKCPQWLRDYDTEAYDEIAATIQTLKIAKRVALA